jgi:hypothetical protein
MRQIKALTVGATVALFSCLFRPSLAVTFGQTAVNQDKLIAIAVPRASGYYNLIVLEQLSDKKPCWRESGSKPTQVEPLLVNFNFTGICGRSTDSNGYSLRVVGQDLGMTHRLSLQKRGNDLVLLGMPSSEKDKPVEVGRTNGIRPGFLKIILSPGWQFAKRTYSGKTLGHVYISRGTPVPPSPTVQPSSGKPSGEKPSGEKPSGEKPSGEKLPASKPSGGKPSKGEALEPLPNKSQPSPKSVDVAANPIRPVLFPGKPTPTSAKPTPTSAKSKQSRKRQVTASPQSLPRRQTIPTLSGRPTPVQPTPTQPVSTRSTPSQPRRQPVASQPPTPKPSNKLYQVMVIAMDSAQQDKVRDKMPNAFRTSYKGKTVMQVGLFSDRRKAESLETDLKREGFKVVLTQKKGQKTAALSESEEKAIAPDSSVGIPSAVETPPSAGPASINVPSVAPIGNAKGAQNIYMPQAQGYLAEASALPPPPPNTAVARYRVIVPAQSADQQAKIRALVPGAFRVRHKGQSAMQVGSFASAEEAGPVMQLMEQHGLTPVTDPS